MPISHQVVPCNYCFVIVLNDIFTLCVCGFFLHIPMQVQLDRLPPEKHGLTFSAAKFGVEAHEDKVIEVIWTPCKPESWHHVIRVKNSHHLRLDIGIACTSVDPQMVTMKEQRIIFQA